MMRIRTIGDVEEWNAVEARVPGVDDAETVIWRASSGEAHDCWTAVLGRVVHIMARLLGIAHRTSFPRSVVPQLNDWPDTVREEGGSTGLEPLTR